MWILIIWGISILGLADYGLRYGIEEAILFAFLGAAVPLWVMKVVFGVYRWFESFFKGEEFKVDKAES